MSSLCLRHLIVGLRLTSMYNIDKFYRILDKEHRYVISHDVPVSFFSIEFHGKATNISDSICAAATAKNGGETQEDGSRS